MSQGLCKKIRVKLGYAQHYIAAADLESKRIGASKFENFCRTTPAKDGAKLDLEQWVHRFVRLSSRHFLQRGGQLT